MFLTTDIDLKCILEEIDQINYLFVNNKYLTDEEKNKLDIPQRIRNIEICLNHYKNFRYMFFGLNYRLCSRNFGRGSGMDHKGDLLIIVYKRLDEIKEKIGEKEVIVEKSIALEKPAKKEISCITKKLARWHSK